MSQGSTMVNAPSSSAAPVNELSNDSLDNTAESGTNSDPYMYMDNYSNTVDTQEEITEPEMIAEEEVSEPEITEPDNNSEHQSIMDFIDQNRLNDETQARDTTPDLFSDQNVHELETSNSDESNDDNEIDQDLLEIPSFLRRQSK